jgi:hypothetical protein
MYKWRVTVHPVTTLSDLLPALSDELPQVIREVVDLLREEWPDYAQFLSDDPAGVAQTAQAAVQRLITPAEPSAAEGGGLLDATLGGTELFEELGRVEWREGRALPSLLSAYRAGARVAWQHMSRLALRRNLPPESIATLAEAVFVFVEELSSASARGYVEEQHSAVAERERLRTELGEVLMSERADTTTIRGTAAAAGWPLPATAALVVVDPLFAQEFLARLDSRALPVRRPEFSGAIVADPKGPGRRAQLAAGLRGLGAVVGMAVPLEQLPRSVRAAVAASALGRQGILSGDPIFVDEHLDALVVHSDERLLQVLTTRMLSPLDGLPDAGRRRLEETLTQWLRQSGDLRAVAQALHVHPQTVRYRLNRLRTLFGTALDEPDTRLSLTLALCWSRPLEAGDRR